MIDLNQTLSAMFFPLETLLIHLISFVYVKSSPEMLFPFPFMHINTLKKSYR